MRLVSFSHDGQFRLGSMCDTGTTTLIFDLNQLEPQVPADMNSFLEAGEIARARAEEAVKKARPEAGLDLDRVILRAPVPRPGKIIAIGQNYLMHAAEAKSAASKYPIVFAKYGNTLIGSGDSIVIPKLTQEVDYEGELAVVIGRYTKGVSEAEALTCVAGYTAMNDVSARDYQHLTSQWTIGKSFDTFGPLGPALVTADEVPDPQDLDLRVTINGEVMQAASTREMIFPVARLISILSAVMTLAPGDIIATGTPAGIGAVRKPPRWLRPGDLVRVEIQTIGVLENPVVAEL